MYPELDQLDLVTLQKRFEEAPPEGEEYARAYYDEVAVRIRNAGGETGIRYLMEWGKRGDPIRLGSAFLALTMPPPTNRADVRSLLKSRLADPDERVASAAIDGLAHLSAPELRDDVFHLRRDDRPHVRAAVLRYVARTEGQTAIRTLIDALSDPDPVVRESAIDTLDELDAAEALPAVSNLASDSSGGVREAAETFIRNRGT